jgi:hypothetical protein
MLIGAILHAVYVDIPILILIFTAQFAILLILAAWIGEIHTRVRRLDRNRPVEVVPELSEIPSDFDKMLEAAVDELPDRLRFELKERGITVVGAKETPRPGVAGLWAPSLQTIFIYERVVPKHDVPRVLMHEVCHALGFSHEQMRISYPQLVPPVDCHR